MENAIVEFTFISHWEYLRAKQVVEVMHNEYNLCGNLSPTTTQECNQLRARILKYEHELKNTEHNNTTAI